MVTSNARLAFVCLFITIYLSSSILFAQAVNVNISVDAATPGYRINDDFVGLSLEQKTLTTDGGGGNTVGSFWVATPSALTRFRNLLTNISPNSIIRVGGNSADWLSWTAGARGSNTDVNKLYNSDIDKLFGFLSTVGWKSIYTVNFAKDSANYAGNAVTEAAQEANYVYSTYGNLLKSISIGNEPMAYVVNNYRNTYDPALYVANYLPVYDAIKSVNPAIPISGGDIGRRTEYNTWNGTYLQKMNNLSATSPARPINTFNVHAYPFRANELTGTAEQSIDALINSLSPGSPFQSNLNYLTNLASSYNTPFRLSETNSITEGAGTAGVVNSFATAIWALDYLYTLANYKAEGANFHSGGNSLSYAPLYRVSAANGTYAIGSIYYGLLAFVDGARNQRLLPVTPQMTASAPRASYYATRSDDGKSLKITLINKDFANTINATVNIPGITIGTASYQTLRPQTNMYDVAANTFYANAQVATDGSFSKGTPTVISPVNPTSFNVSIAPMTAVVATVSLQAPMPVNLISFKGAVLDNRAIELNWQTSLERSNNYFEVQRSSDAEIFTTIGRVNGKGTTDKPNTYHQTDNQPLLGINYYRLKQVDLDGTSAYSQTIAVTYRGGNFLTIYPNPVVDQVNIQFRETTNMQSVRVYDQTGRLLQQLNPAGIMSLQGLPQGTYYIEIVTQEGQTYRKSVIKQ